MADLPASQRRPTLADVAAAAGVSRATASRAMSATRRMSARRLASASGPPWSGSASSPTTSRASLRSGSTMARRDRGAGRRHRRSSPRALKGAQELLEAVGLPRARGQHGSRRRARETRGAADAARPPGRRAASWPPRAATRTSACRPCSSTTCRAARGAGAVALCNARRASRRWSSTSCTAHGLERLAYVGPPAAPSRGVAPFTHRRRRASASTASAPPSGAPGCALPPEYVRTSDPACTAAEAAAVARELLALPERPQGDRRGRRHAGHGRAATPRAGAACDVPGDVALVSFDEPAYADLHRPADHVARPPRPAARAPRGRAAARRAGRRRRDVASRRWSACRSRCWSAARAAARG